MTSTNFDNGAKYLMRWPVAKWPVFRAQALLTYGNPANPHRNDGTVLYCFYTLCSLSVHDSEPSFVQIQDDCPDGRITPERFEKLYATCFANRDTKEFSKYVFKALDTDKNGYIDFREFMLATTIGRVDNPQEKLQWAFKIYDVDGNGYIDKVEMIRILKAIFQMSGKSDKEPADGTDEKSAEGQALKIFTKLDKDKDGKVSADEFVKGCMEDEILNRMLSK